MVSIGIEGLEVRLGGICSTGTRDSVLEDTAECVNKAVGEACCSEALQDLFMVPVGSHMGSTNPAHHVSGTSIKVE